MAKSLRAVHPAPFTEWDVNRSFNYEDYLQDHARKVALRIGQNNPAPTMYYIRHPNATHEHDWTHYQQVGEIYCRKPMDIPSELLEEFEGDGGIAERYVVCMERLTLDPHFRRYGFLRMLKEALAEQRFRYLILSQMPDYEFTRYLHTCTQDEESAIELMTERAVAVHDGICTISTFAIRLV